MVLSKAKRKKATGCLIASGIKIPGWSLRTKHHNHLPALHLWIRLDFCKFLGVALDPQKKIPTKLLMRHFAATESQGDFHLVAIVEEFLHRPQLDVVVVRVDVGAHLDLFDLDDFLFLLGFVGLFLGLVFVLAKIKDFADRRLGIWRNFDKIESSLQSDFHSICGAHHPLHFTLCINHQNLFGGDRFVGARAYISSRRCPVRSAAYLKTPWLSYLTMPNWHQRAIHASTGALSQAKTAQFLSKIYLRGMRMSEKDPEFSTYGTGNSIAARKNPGSSTLAQDPGLFWMGGFKSSMDGTKATALANWSEENRRVCTRFDYSGHGVSGGEFEEGTISAWLEESLGVFEEHTTGSQIVIGSSMGGWLAMLLYRELSRRIESARVHALVLIAPAADMTVRIWEEFPEDVRQQIMDTGIWHRPSAYGDGDYAITKGLIEDGRNHLILNEITSVACPVRILHGEEDPDVPWQHGHKLYRQLEGSDITFTLIKGGDHRLSSDQEIERLLATISALA